MNSISNHPYREIESVENLPAPDGSGRITRMVFQNIDFNQVPQYVAAGHKFIDCCFMGCRIPKEMERGLGKKCLIFPALDLTYNSFRGGLYNRSSLYEGYTPGKEETFADCYDTRVYNDYIQNGKHCDNILETLGRSLHDHSIENAMFDFLSHYDEKQIVAVMGGHALKRTDKQYRNVVTISKALVEKGKLMASGGGPGAMEATHLGAWMAGRTAKEVDDALSILEAAPTFRDEGWLRTAFEVIEKYPQERFRSLGIPTWFYGHEPATPFATDIAKFFSNSIREDSLLAIAMGGIIYTPGSAGTLQEIFQDAAQNHYETFGYASPMVFLGKEFFTKDVPVFPLLEDLVRKGRYKNLPISLTDDPVEAVKHILAFTEQDNKKR
ncbi:MAG: hypothetical protein IJT26_06890 [Bacteroidales bacterium]|nr:hypothetical protein [Bacteroidales bacterium]